MGAMDTMLASQFVGQAGLAEENIQSRLRGRSDGTF